jgi:uncharacterized membrane protein YbaN (DUF454 family)
MLRPILIALGSLSLALGLIGVAVPGLPTTPFLLLSAACYVRSSERLYGWLLNHRVFGRYIREYRRNRGMSLRAKLVALALMWTMILLSATVFVGATHVRAVILLLGMVGTVSLLLVPTSPPARRDCTGGTP